MSQAVVLGRVLLKLDILYVHYMSPFRALYGYDPLIFIDLLFSDSRVSSAGDFLQDSQDIIRTLWDNIQRPLNQQKQYVD